MNQLPTSIGNMSLGNRFIQTLADVPIDPRIKGHSIVAVDGAGPFENLNDGVVAYKSAHIEGVESELVVRSTYSTQATPATSRMRASSCRRTPASTAITFVDGCANSNLPLSRCSSIASRTSAIRLRREPPHEHLRASCDHGRGRLIRLGAFCAPTAPETAAPSPDRARCRNRARP
jgi:hypothetical protein